MFQVRPCFRFVHDIKLLVRYLPWHIDVFIVVINTDVGRKIASYPPSIREECTASIKARPKESVSIAHLLQRSLKCFASTLYTYMPQARFWQRPLSIDIH